MPKLAQALGPDWLSLAQAAEVLGVSIDTARRRVRRGELDAVQIPGAHGSAWHVRLPAHARVGTPNGEIDAQARPGLPMVIEASIEPTVQALLAYLRERDQQRDAELAQLREDLARARADLVDHAAELAKARAELLALAAPVEPASTERPQTGDSEHAPVEPPQTSSAPPKRVPWWRWWMSRPRPAG